MLLRGTFKMSKTRANYFVFLTKPLSITVGGQQNENVCWKEGKPPENFRARNRIN